MYGVVNGTPSEGDPGAILRASMGHSLALRACRQSLIDTLKG